MEVVMRLFILTIIIALFGSVSVMAFSNDERTMNGANASKFSDPDEKTPNNYLQGKEASSGSVDPASVRYEYDPSTGSYRPH